MKDHNFKITNNFIHILNFCYKSNYYKKDFKQYANNYISLLRDKEPFIY